MQNAQTSKSINIDLQEVPFSMKYTMQLHQLHNNVKTDAFNFIHEKVLSSEVFPREKRNHLVTDIIIITTFHLS